MGDVKNVYRIHRNPDAHWVGDGFPVRTIFSHDRLGPTISPFLLLDYAGPADFAPAEIPRGVGEHPHRGFETVTVVYQGEVEHRDSAGNSGSIGPGDVQWMTAASGVIHEEKHSEEFTRRGGTLEMVQLWVNLPAKFKMTRPRYQTLLNKDIPAVETAGGGGTVRVIAGEYEGRKGPAQTFTPVNVWDVRLKAGRGLKFSLPSDFNTEVVVLRGKLMVNRSESVGAADLVLFENEGQEITLAAQEGAKEDAAFLVLNGEPIPEPIASYGPFVMNTQEEIRQAMDNYRTGRMGTLDIPIK